MTTEESIIKKNSNRRQIIIDFVRNHPLCTKEKVIAYCTQKGEGTRVPVRKTIKELIDEEILDEGKDKKNSFYKLTISSENLLLTIPQDLGRIHEEFKTFVDKVKEKEIEGISLNYNHTNSGHKDWKFYKGIKSDVPLLSYYLIDIINDVYTFYFIVILSNKLNDNVKIHKLYAIYFENLEKMYSYISKDTQHMSGPTDDTSIETSNLFKSYMKSKGESIFGKVWNLANICRVIGIEDHLYGVLDYLWLKNEESVVLLYGANKFSDEYSIHSKLKEEPIAFQYSNRILNKIHNQIEFYIFFMETSNEEDRAFSN
jgi:hypothetical protein